MKKNATIFILFILLTQSIFSQNNSLIVYSQDGFKFTVILNGIRQNPTPETNHDRDSKYKSNRRCFLPPHRVDRLEFSGQHGNSSRHEHRIQHGMARLGPRRNAQAFPL